MKRNKKLYRLAREAGFTLIEMLLVIGIIAVIVSIAVPALQDMKSDAQAKKQASLTYAIEQAKLRAVIASSATPGTPALWNQFSKFLNIEGMELKTDSDITKITSAQNNGTGKNIWWWGKYPNTDGSAHATVNFDTNKTAITAVNWSYAWNGYNPNL